MPRSKSHPRKREPIPENFESIEAFQDFWDVHSSADYEESMEEVEVEIDLRSSRVYCAVAKDLLTQLRAQARG